MDSEQNIFEQKFRDCQNLDQARKTANNLLEQEATAMGGEARDLLGQIREINNSGCVDISAAECACELRQQLFQILRKTEQGEQIFRAHLQVKKTFRKQVRVPAAS